MLPMKQLKISPIDDRLCFTLYSTSQAIIKNYRPFLQKMKMTYSQYLVYIVLYEQGELTVNALGKYLHLDSGTLTPLLKRMEVQQRIVRVRSQQDERKVLVKLTDEALELAPDIADMQSKVACSTKLDQAQFNTLLGQLKKLNTTLRIKS